MLIICVCLINYQFLHVAYFYAFTLLCFFLVGPTIDLKEPRINGDGEVHADLSNDVDVDIPKGKGNGEIDINLPKVGENCGLSSGFS